MEKLGNKDLGTVKNNNNKNKTKILWDGCWLCLMALARLMAFRVKHRDWSFVAEWQQTSLSVWLSHSIQTLHRYYPCCLCEGIFRMGTITYTCIRGLRVKQTILTTDRVSFVQWHLKKNQGEGLLPPDGLWTWLAASALPLLSSLPCRFCTHGPHKLVSPCLQEIAPPSQVVGSWSVMLLSESGHGETAPNTLE